MGFGLGPEAICTQKKIMYISLYCVSRIYFSELQCYVLFQTNFLIVFLFTAPKNVLLCCLIKAFYSTQITCKLNTVIKAVRLHPPFGLPGLFKFMT